MNAPLPASTTREIAPELARSWLLVAATRPETFDAAAASHADAVVLDIEDAVDASHKDEARDDVIRWLSVEGNSAWVRINDATSEHWGADIEGLRSAPGLKGVMLAKTEYGGQVMDTYNRLGAQVPVVALVESAIGIENATEIARAKGAFRLAFGSGDFRRDTGMSADREAMAYPRARLVISSRAGGLPGPIDGPTVGSSHPILREQSAITVSMGMTGKLCLSADQTPVVNEVISPTRTDVEWAYEFLEDFDARGRIVRDGSDLPRLGRARKIMQLAEAFGVTPNGR